MKLVVYDLDHTLMPIDTGDIWCKWLLRACEKAVRVTAEETLDRFTREYIEQTLNIDEYEMWQMQFLAQFNRADLDAARKAYRAEVLEKILPASSVRIVNEANKRAPSRRSVRLLTVMPRSLPPNCSAWITCCRSDLRKTNRAISPVAGLSRSRISRAK